jgi:predicted TIM-barrel fold metal-dependent hydrolase
VQTLDAETAIRLSREVNDWLADFVKQYPDRFAAFAMVPTQKPSEAAAELERSVKLLGFKGALINGHTHGHYLDEPAFSPLLSMAESLDVPIYLHPWDPPQEIKNIYYPDWPVTQNWGFQVETGTHLLKMMTGGVFDRYPDLKIIVGHMGELLPFTLDRLNRGTTMGNWLVANQKKDDVLRKSVAMQKSIRYYMRQNVFITSSGVFDQAALTCSIEQLGIDNVLFSVDDPFADNFEGVDFLKHAVLSKDDKEKFAHGNAERILKLGPRSNVKRKAKRRFSAYPARAKAAVGRALLSFLVK